MGYDQKWVIVAGSTLRYVEELGRPWTYSDVGGKYFFRSSSLQAEGIELGKVGGVEQIY